MSRHLVDKLHAARASITITSGDQAFAKCDYGEPKVIVDWPYLSVQPIRKGRELRGGGTRKFEIQFEIALVLYHGKVEDTLTIQEGAHERAEAIEVWLHSAADVRPFKWNFVDTEASNDKVTFGFVDQLDHPIVIAPEDELWSTSRLTLRALSEEVF